MKAKIKTGFDGLKAKLCERKKGSTDVIVAAILLVIAVGLIITFRDSITTWLSDLSTYLGGQLTQFTS